MHLLNQVSLYKQHLLRIGDDINSNYFVQTPIMADVTTVLDG